MSGASGRAILLIIPYCLSRYCPYINAVIISMILAHRETVDVSQVISVICKEGVCCVYNCALCIVHLVNRGV